MPYEVEQKFPLADVAAIESRLRSLGATIEPAVTQVDEYFAHPARDFATTDEAFRIRSVGDANYLTYKGPKLDKATKTRREIEIPIASGAEAAGQAREMFLALGFASVAIVRKDRRRAAIPWQGVEVEGALDSVASLGAYLELELMADEAGLAHAKESLATLATHLQLRESERRSYLELLLAQSSRP